MLAVVLIYLISAAVVAGASAPPPFWYCILEDVVQVDAICHNDHSRFLPRTEHFEIPARAILTLDESIQFSEIELTPLIPAPFIRFH